MLLDPRFPYPSYGPGEGEGSFHGPARCGGRLTPTVWLPAERAGAVCVVGAHVRVHLTSTSSLPLFSNNRSFRRHLVLRAGREDVGRRDSQKAHQSRHPQPPSNPRRQGPTSGEPRLHQQPPRPDPTIHRPSPPPLQPDLTSPAGLPKRPPNKSCFGRYISHSWRELTSPAQSRPDNKQSPTRREANHIMSQVKFEQKETIRSSVGGGRGAPPAKEGLGHEIGEALTKAGGPNGYLAVSDGRDGSTQTSN